MWYIAMFPKHLCYSPNSLWASLFIYQPLCAHRHLLPPLFSFFSSSSLSCLALPICRGVSCPVASIFLFTTPHQIIRQRALPAPHLALAQQLCPPRALPTWASDRRQATYYRTDPVILVDSDPSILPTRPLKAASTATSSTNAIG